jgi:hypothetical protein
VALAKAGKLLFQAKPADHLDKLVFSGDNVHPYTNTGHKLYAEAFSRAFTELDKIPANKQKHILLAPFVKDNWEKARMFSVKEIARTTGWQEITPTNRYRSKTIAKPLSIPDKISHPRRENHHKI